MVYTKKMRTSKRISADALAEASGFSRVTVYNAEKRGVSKYTSKCLIQALNLCESKQQTKRGIVLAAVRTIAGEFRTSDVTKLVGFNSNSSIRHLLETGHIVISRKADWHVHIYKNAAIN